MDAQITGRRKEVLETSAKEHGAAVDGNIIPVVRDLTSRVQRQELIYVQQMDQNDKESIKAAVAEISKKVRRLLFA